MTSSPTDLESSTMTDQNAEAAGEQLAGAVTVACGTVPDLALLSDLPDALRLLGVLQAAHGQLGQLITDTERELLTRGADAGELETGELVTVEHGSLSYKWSPVREVLKSAFPDLIALDPEITYRAIDRVEAMLPPGVKWSRPGVGAYADVDELSSSKRSRTRLKVTFPTLPEPEQAPAP